MFSRVHPAGSTPALIVLHQRPGRHPRRISPRFGHFRQERNTSRLYRLVAPVFQHCELSRVVAPDIGNLHPYATCVQFVKALFIELPAFERNRCRYLDDEGFQQLQIALLRDPAGGNVIESTGGLRKLRFGDKRRGKGKRGGLRVVYYYWNGGPQFWLFTVYDKDETADLTPRQRTALKERLKLEIAARGRDETKAQVVR